jgi:hypothetical protein
MGFVSKFNMYNTGMIQVNSNEPQYTDKYSFMKRMDNSNSSHSQVEFLPLNNSLASFKMKASRDNSYHK